MKITQSALTSLFIALTLFTSSCAAIFTGTTDDVQFDSNPRGAFIVVGEQEGRTPCLLTLPKSTTEYTIRYEGEEAITVPIERSFQGGMLLLDILFTPGYGLVGILIDGPTSAFYKLPPMAFHDSTLPVEVESEQDEAVSTSVASADRAPEA